MKTVWYVACIVKMKLEYKIWLRRYKVADDLQQSVVADSVKIFLR